METTTTVPTPAAPAARRLLRVRDFRLLWSAYAVSAVGTEVTVLAVPLAAAVLLGATPLQMGILTAAGTAPYVGFALLAGAWIDRLPRRRPLLVTADLVAATALLTVPLAYVADVLTVSQLVVVELVVGFARVTFRPAFQAHLPDVVRRQELTRASGHLRAAESAAMLGGPGLGGTLVQVLTAPVAVVVDALSFVVSAVLVSRVSAPERVDDVPPPRRRLREEVREGLVHLWQDRRLRAIAGSAANLNFFGLMIFALLVVYLTRDLGFTPLMIAAVTMAGGLGALTGALVAPRVADRIGRGRTFLLATSVFSVGMFAFPAASGPRWMALTVLMVNEAAVGVAIMLFDVTNSAFVLESVPRAVHGRVNSSLSTLTQGVKPLGALAGGALASAVGMRPALWVAAVGATTTVLWMLFSPFRHDAAGTVS
ncbi:MAG TPA: MFS transporter [Actinomycetes bacterium]